MSGVEQTELSFEVGLARRGEKPSLASFKMRGPVDSASRELYVDDDIQVVILDADGQVLVSAYGHVAGVSFKKHRPARQRPWVERIHTIKLGELAEQEPLS